MHQEGKQTPVWFKFTEVCRCEIDLRYLSWCGWSMSLWFTKVTYLKSVRREINKLTDTDGVKRKETGGWESWLILYVCKYCLFATFNLETKNFFFSATVFSACLFTSYFSCMNPFSFSHFVNTCPYFTNRNALHLHVHFIDIYFAYTLNDDIILSCGSNLQQYS